MADAVRPGLPGSVAVPAPPVHGTPALRRVPAGRWWRVHRFSAASGAFSPNAFNDSGQGNARFSPLLQRGKVVPTLYAAATLESALMETVLHDVPFPSSGHIHDLERDLRGDLHASELETAAPLQLADLTKIGLQRIGLRVSEVFETDADGYPRLRDWAAWIHAALPQAQGLYWMSARQPESAAMMLFGDRVRPGLLRQGKRLLKPISDPAVLSCVLMLLERLGCGVASNR